jgi:hypothetical protein
MADRVLIPLPGIGTLELTAAAYAAALRPMTPPEAVSNAHELKSAEELEAATGVPASWFATQARERRIPFRKLGRYVRFDLEEVLACKALQRRAIPNGELCTGSQNRKGHANA